jgi:hypothetical protein
VSRRPAPDPIAYAGCVESDADLTTTLVGALSGLATAVVVQLLLVPWRDARTRKKERWETAVLELQSLVEEQLPRAVAEFRSAADLERYIRARAGDPTVNPDRYDEAKHSVESDRRAASEVIGNHLQRMTLLTRSIMRVRPRATVFVGLWVSHATLEICAKDLTYSMILQDAWLRDDRWEAVWEEQAAAQRDMASRIDQIADSMRWPLPYWISQSRYLVRRSARKVKSVCTKKAASSTPENSEPGKAPDNRNPARNT